MAVLLLFLASVLASLYITNYLALNRQTREMLERYVSMYSLDALPGSEFPELPPLPEENIPLNSDNTLFQLSSFYSAAISDDHEILAVDAGRNIIYSRQDIIELAETILKEGKKTGRLTNLMYQVDKREGYTLAAFADTTLIDNDMKSLLLSTLVAGCISVCILYAAAVFLARKIVRPLEENDIRQKQFISDAEHELKTPISVISANAEILSRQIGQNEWLDNIQYENERMSALVKQLLDLSRAENGVSNQEKINLTELIEQEVLPFESIAYEHGMTINTALAENIAVTGSRQQLCQLISILTDNAVSHSKDGKSIDIDLHKEHGNAVFSITNSGEISESEKEHLFDRFYRPDQARRENGSHYGLGLPIAKAVAEAHHGKISINSHDKTVTATVCLPMDK